MTADRPRCAWVHSGDDPLALAYHDKEWGVPSRDLRHLFEMLTLEGAQSGLSWMTILRKREGYRRAFSGFDVEAVARFDDADVERLLADAGIVRNRAKVESTIANARALLALREAGEDPVEWLWRYVGGSPVQNAWRELSELPAQTPQSLAMSKSLKAAGFRFLGPTTCYSFMQAVGLVNDHVIDCYRHAEVAQLA